MTSAPDTSQASGVWGSLRGLPALLRQARLVYPDPGLQAWRRRLSFEWSALRHAREHRALVAFFAEPAYAPVAQTHPQLLQKVHKPYAMRGLDVAGRVALVCEHYRLAGRLLGPALRQAVAERRDLLLVRVPLPAGRGELPVWLGKQPRFEREGELTLSLHDPFDSLLYSACLTLREVDGAPALLVGSLNGTAPLQTMRHLTKLSLGVRPPSLLVQIMQMLATQLGIARIQAVGRATHAYWGNPRHEEIRFDYDAFWREEGGRLGEDGLFELPPRPRRRAPAEVPAHKRALYARRYAWLDELGSRFDTQARLALAPGPGSAA